MNSAHPINDKAGAPWTGDLIVITGGFPHKLAGVAAATAEQGSSHHG